MKKNWLDTCTSIPEALVSVVPKQLEIHAYSCGGSGSGKTTSIHTFINQDIESGHSFVVLDMRGDLVSGAIELCAGRVSPDKIKHFDLREKERPLGFSPLFGAGEPFFRALNVLAAISNENDLGVQTAETLRYCLFLLAESQAPLTQIELLLTDGDFRASLLKKLNSESMTQFWERFDSLSPDKQTGYVNPVLNKLSLLFATEGLRRMLGHQCPTDIGKHLNTPGSVMLISLAVDELHGAGRMMGSLFLSAICREIFGRVTIPESQRVPVRLYVDEFENFNMDEFEAILAEGRRFKLSLFLANQILAQLTPKIRSMILNNVGVKLFFRTGRDDAAILSKDLTGDPKTFDLASLPRGEAILWCRDQAPIHVELNEPLIPNVGVRSAKAKQLLSELRNAVPPFAPYIVKPVATSIKPEPIAPIQGSLEDWL